MRRFGIGFGVARDHLITTPDEFLTCEQFAKAGFVPNRVPDGIDLQARDRDDLAGRYGKQPPKVAYRVAGRARARFNLCQIRPCKSGRSESSFACS